MTALAVLPVRAGVLPLGGDEAACEAHGVVLLIGSGTEQAAAELPGSVTQVFTAEVGPVAFGAWAHALAPELQWYDVIVLPASPDGRDLAPRLAAELGRPLLAGATEIRGDRVLLARRGGLVTEEVTVSGPYVVTLQPGVRGADTGSGSPPRHIRLELDVVTGGDAEVIEEIPADPATMDLAEAPRVLGAGAGLRGPEDIELLARVAKALGATVGGTRVVTDAGWLPHERQIGTTGVTIDPELYVAFGISGAVQHTAGLGAPRHVVSVNTDPSCPMSAMADLALVTDAPAMLQALADRLKPTSVPNESPAPTTELAEEAASG